jgi:hypothetical protein
VRSRETMGAAVVALLVTGVGTPHAQQPAPKLREQMEARSQIALMEAVLEQAVQLGASNANMQLQAIAPDMVFMTGAPRARGFRLDNYGLFFDVDVPVMRRSLQWTFRVLQRNDTRAAGAIDDLRRKVANIEDPALRQELERDVRRLEREVPVIRTSAGSPGDGSRRAVAASSDTADQSESRRLVDDPNQAYTEAVKSALINAMLEYSTKFALGPDEWLTVAARDQEGSRRASDPYGASTIMLRVKGADVKAFHAGEIELGEARSRIDIREY